MLLFLLETLIHRFLLLKTRVLAHFSVMTGHNSHCFLSLRIASRGQEADRGWANCGLRSLCSQTWLTPLPTWVKNSEPSHVPIFFAEWSWNCSIPPMPSGQASLRQLMENFLIKVAKNLRWIRWRSTAIFHNNVEETAYQNPLTLLVGKQTSTATMENSVEIP